MFNIGAMELLLILLVAFLIVGPNDLPKVARWLARMIKKARDYIDQFKDDMGLDELEADVKEIRTEVEDAMRDADVSDEVRAAQDELRAVMEGVDRDVRQTAADVKQAVEEK